MVRVLILILFICSTSKIIAQFNPEIDSIQEKAMKINLSKQIHWGYPTIITHINYHFSTNGEGKKLVGFGGGRLRKVINDNIDAKRMLNKYATLRYVGFSTMWLVPITSSIINSGSQENFALTFAIGGIGFIIGGIIYHIVAPKFLKKAVNKYNSNLKNNLY